MKSEIFMFNIERETWNFKIIYGSHFLSVNSFQPFRISATICICQVVQRHPCAGFFIQALAQLKPWLKFLSYILGVTTKQNFKHNSPKNHYPPDICTQLHIIVHCSLLLNIILYSSNKNKITEFFLVHHQNLQNTAVCSEDDHL